MGKFCTLDDARRPKAFFDTAVHLKNIPADAIEISDEHWTECINHPGCRQFNDMGELVECEMQLDDVPAPDPLVTARERAKNDPLTAGLLKTVADATGQSIEDLEDAYVANVGQAVG